MKRINSLSDLLMEELSELLNAENKLIELLPQMIDSSQSLTLRLVLEAHRAVAKEHIRRLQDIFSNVGQNPQRVMPNALKELIQEGEGVVSNKDYQQDQDIAIINLVQKVGLKQISGYETTSEHAADLGHTKVVELLNQTANEEREMNLDLNELAQGMINTQAIDPQGKPKGGGFYMPEGKFKRKTIKKNKEVSRFIGEGNPNTQDLGEEVKE